MIHDNREDYELDAARWNDYRPGDPRIRALATALIRADWPGGLPSEREDARAAGEHAAAQLRAREDA